MFIKLSSIVIVITALAMFIACEYDACSNYQDLCNGDADMTMCNELLEEQPNSLHSCIDKAKTCSEIHSCILNIEDETTAKSK
jgi:hypothetical protein